MTFNHQPAPSKSDAGQRRRKVEPGHPALTAFGITAPWRGLVQNDTGELVLPVLDAGRNVVDHLVIGATGNSRFTQDKRPTPHYAVIGGLTNEIKVCLDVEVAARLHAATGQTCIAAFSPAAAKRIVEILSARHGPDGRTVVLHSGADVVPIDAGRRRKSVPPAESDANRIATGFPEAGPEGQPAIIIEGGRLPEMADAACAVLADRVANVFKRGASLVRPVRWSPPPPTLASAKRRSTIARPEGAIVLASLDEPALIDILTRHAAWYRFDLRSHDYVRRDCPSAVAVTILSRRGANWPMLPLKAVVRAPTLRPNGSVLDAAGYDEASQLLLASEESWPPVPAEPTRSQGRAALNTLADILRDFPFVRDVDRSAALAALITPIVRPALATAPIFVVTAPTPGTGKSLIVDLAAMLATGGTPTLISGGADEVELEKRLGATMLAGDPVVSLDNINGALRSEFLCTALTQSAVNVRPLGTSSTVQIPSTAAWFATGNNITIAEDMRRRTVLIRLDARCENPQERTFDRDIVAFVRSERLKLVTAALTAVRAFLVSGADSLDPLGSFEDWSDVVRSALVWLGCPDPLENASILLDNDPVRERAAAIFRALAGIGAFTVGEVGRRIADDPDLREALQDYVDFRHNLDPKKFGSFLRRHRDRNVGGLTLSQVDKVKDIARWRVG